MNDKEVKHNVKQVQLYQTVTACIQGAMTNQQAAEALRLSVRQIQRIKRRVKDRGPAGIPHGNTGRPPPNRMPDRIRQKAIALATGEYAKFNFSHLADMLAAEHGIRLSAETLRLWLRPMGHGRPVRRVKKHRRRRQRSAKHGELLFLDGSPHHWFGPQHDPCCLILASDDATGNPLRGKFQPQEDRDGCFEVCLRLFMKFGLPAAFYLDRASQFKVTKHGPRYSLRASRQPAETHFQRAMRQLRVGIIFAHSPQARGRAERLNGSFQDRLVAELEHKGITTPSEATRFLNSSFIPRYVKRFGRQPRDPVPAWRPLPDQLDLDGILCFQCLRTVANDNTVCLDGVTYQLQPPQDLWHLVRHKIQVQKRPDGSVRFKHRQYGYIKGRRIANDQYPAQSNHDSLAQQLHLR